MAAHGRPYAEEVGIRLVDEPGLARRTGDDDPSGVGAALSVTASGGV
ncbi:MAG: hypothetical protein JWN84_1048 [Nocardioides sp.]|jgi:hypothetical protein|nr:hypothetical protein [Nocardioides sp.]